VYAFILLNMDTMNRTELHSLLRSVAVVCLAGGILGISYGALAIGYGLPWWIPLLLSIAVVAGASEMMFVAIIGAGGSPWLAAAAGLLVNARHIPFGFQVSPLMGNGLRSILGAHAINDESTSFALAGSSPAMRRLGFWACGVGIVLVWPLGTALGTWLGAFLGDLDRWGLDAVFPAMILALVIPKARAGGAPLTTAVVLGAAITVATASFLPAGLPELLSLAAVAVARPWRPVKTEPELTS
jgi:predicted branched-subunit amino acid permease